MAASDFLCVKRDCGAIPKSNLTSSVREGFINANALEACLNRASKEGPNKVVVPKGFAFSSMPVAQEGLRDVVL